MNAEAIVSTMVSAIAVVARVMIVATSISAVVSIARIAIPVSMIVIASVVVVMTVVVIAPITHQLNGITVRGVGFGNARCPRSELLIGTS